MTDAWSERADGVSWGIGHQIDLAFKTEARQAHLLAEWAAKEMGLPTEQVYPYVKRITAMVAQPHGFPSPAEVVYSHLLGKNSSPTLADVEAKLASFYEQARIDVGAVSASLAASAGQRATALDGRSATGGALQELRAI